MSNELISTCPHLLLNTEVIPEIKTLVFDRDGTINLDAGYVHQISDFAFTPEFLDILEILGQFKGNICIITNQGGASIGKYFENESRQFTEHLLSLVREFGINVSLVVACYHHNDDNCDYRKPAPGMLRKIQSIVNSDSKMYLYIGNDRKDAEAAKDCNIAYLDIKSENLARNLLDWIDAP